MSRLYIWWLPTWELQSDLTHWPVVYPPEGEKVLWKVSAVRRELSDNGDLSHRTELDWHSLPAASTFICHLSVVIQCFVYGVSDNLFCLWRLSDLSSLSCMRSCHIHIAAIVYGVIPFSYVMITIRQWSMDFISATDCSLRMTVV